MAFVFFIKGVIIGFIMGIPAGPIGAFTITQVFTYGTVSGLVSGLGSCTADMLYGCIAAFGITCISDFLMHNQMLFRIIGGIAVLILGIKTVYSKNQKTVISSPQRVSSLWQSFLTSFVLSITNPAAILAYLVLFAGYGIMNNCSSFSAFYLILGVFCGAGIWWVILTAIVNAFKSKISQNNIFKVNKILGSIIILFGLALLVSIGI